MAKKKRAGATEKNACTACGARRPLFWHGRRKICEPCIVDTAHAAELGPITRRSVIAGAVALAREVGGKAAIIGLAFALPSIALTPYLAHDEAMAWSFVLGYVQLIGLGAALDLGVRVLDREEPRVGIALLTGLKKSLPLLLAIFIQQLIVIVHAIFLLVPAFMKACSYAILTPLVVSDESGPIRGLSESTRRMHGHRKTLFPLLMLLWIPGLAVAFFELAYGTSDIPIFPGNPDADALLRTAIGFAYPLLELPWLFVVLSLHAKLRRDIRVPAVD